jgi:hypothetical protein
MSLGLPGGYCLEGACINAGVEVDEAARWEKENRVHVNVDWADEDVIDGAIECCKA